MKKIKKEIYKYITDDGEVFDTKEDALRYEYKSIRDRLCNTKLKIGEYDIYKINNREELIAFKETSNLITTKIKFDIDDIKTFPILICEEYCDDYYYSTCRTIEDVIIHHEQIIKELKRIK